MTSAQSGKKGVGISHLFYEGGSCQSGLLEKPGGILTWRHKRKEPEIPVGLKPNIRPRANGKKIEAMNQLIEISERGRATVT